MKRDPFQTAAQSKWVTCAILITAFAAVFFMDQLGILSRQIKGLLVPIAINMILAVSLNLIVGFLGELSLGHAGFMAVGAYAGCLFSVFLQDALPAAVRFSLALLVGGILAAVFGFLIAIPVLRLKGDYLAIVTLAFGQIICSVAMNLDITGGPSGLKGTPQDASYPVAFILVLLTVIVLGNVMDSRYGRAIASIRDSRIAASCMGIYVTRYRLCVFASAAFFAGIAGVLYGHNISILQASVFDYNKSVEILVMVVLGGMYSIRGSVIAAAFITVLPELFRGADEYRMLVYSIALIGIMLLKANGPFQNFKARLFKTVLYRKRGKEKAVVKEDI